jgi:spermidine/putrescine transport system permease protein
VNRTRFGERPTAFYVMAAYALVVYAFLFAPIAIVILMSFNSARYSSFPLEQFTGRWYAELIANASIWDSVQNSLLVAAATTALATTLGTMAAFALSRYQFRFKTAFTAVLLVPLIVPGIIMGVSLLSLYNFLGIPTSLLTVILGHTALALPYAALVIAARLQGFDRHLEEAAASLGAPYYRVFARVTLPLLAPGVIAAGLFAWTISFDEFIITFFVAGIRQTLPLRIWSLLKFGLSPTINAISTIILLVALLLVTWALTLSGRRRVSEGR